MRLPERSSGSISPLFAPEAQQSRLIIAHDDPGAEPPMK